MSLSNTLIRLSPKIPTTRMGMVRRELEKSDGISILDLGCGDGHSMKLILHGLKRGFLIAGIDAYPKSLVTALKLGIYEILWRGDIRCWNYKPKSYDTIFLCEILEHLPKEDGHQLLDKLDKVARNLIIITSPPHWDNDPNAIREEPIEERFQKGELWRIPHISLWKEADYKKHGYTTKGANGLYIPKLPILARTILGMILTPLIWHSPDRANTIVAVKRF